MKTPIFVLLAITAAGSIASAQSERPHWSEDASRFWFRSPVNNETRFVIVDVASRTRNDAFDLNKLAAAFSDALSRSVNARDLSVSSIAFTPESDELLLVRKGERWRLNLKSYKLARIPGTVPHSARRLFMPPRRSGASEEATNITVENKLDEPLQLLWIGRDGRETQYAQIAPGGAHRQHTFVGHVWLIKTDKRLGCFSAERQDRVVINEAAISSVSRQPLRPRRQRGRARGRFETSATSPDGKWTVEARDHNLWLKSGDGSNQLTRTGTDGNSFAQGGRRPRLLWSPTSNHLVAFQSKAGTNRTVYFIESSPGDQLQPKLQSYQYDKPGDDITTQTVHLFSVPDMTEIPVSHELIKNPWAIRFAGWSKSGDRFYLHYNQRGHQTIRLLEVSAVDGTVRPIVEETSDTFLHYSDRGKSVFEDLNEDEFLWASERSGWNHLYRYSRAERKLLNAVTVGEWNVKRIEQIDRENKRIWFYAVGVRTDQDPYHEHFCRVNFDGSGFTVLTKGDGTHKCEFEQEGKYFIDTYSRVDLAPVRELRESETGELITELSSEDAALQFKGRRLTERFVAKGRDGITDIWGIIHWPRNFDPDKKYPVVENIYAGPHDHHVPKSFRTRYGHQHRIADAGMIVVQIDGMGTAWRSKKFHDVCYKNLRDAGFPDRIAWMKAAAEKYPQMDISRVGIYGGSAGGQNAMAALLWHNDFYRVAVADCGCHDNRMDKIWWNEQWMGWPVDDSYKQNSNMENAHRLKGDLMLLVGELDRNVDPASTTQVVSKLIKANKDFDFVLVAGAGHGSAETPWGSRKRLNFLKEHLGVD